MLAAIRKKQAGLQTNGGALRNGLAVGCHASGIGSKLRGRTLRHAFTTMARDGVRGFVTHHNRKFIIRLDKIHKACVHGAVAAGKHPCVDHFGIVNHGPLPHHVVGDFWMALLGRCGNSRANFLHALVHRSAADDLGVLYFRLISLRAHRIFLAG